MKRAILLTLHVLGWVAFVPFAVLAVFALFAFSFREAGFPSRWYHVVGLSAAMLGYGLPGLATVIATRVALRQMARREPPPRGFEPIVEGDSSS